MPLIVPIFPVIINIIIIIIINPFNKFLDIDPGTPTTIALTAIFILFTQPLRSGRIWHKVNF